MRGGKLVAVATVAVFILLLYSKVPVEVENKDQLLAEFGGNYQTIDLSVIETMQYGDQFPIDKINNKTDVVIPTVVERNVELQVTRTLTDKFGNTDTKTIKNDLVDLFAFVSDKDSSIPRDGTEISVSITTKIREDREFITSGKYEITINNVLYKTDTFSKTGKSDSEGNIEIYKIIEKLDNLLKDKPNGIYKITYKISQFYVIEKYQVDEGDDTRFYLEAPITVYENEFEVNEAKTIIKNEHGEFIKIYNIDIPFSMLNSGTSVPQLAHCLYRDRSTGCSSYAYTSRAIPAVSIPEATLQDSETGKELGRGTNFQLNLQRNHEYIFTFNGERVIFKTSENYRTYESGCSPKIIQQDIKVRGVTMPYYWYTDGTPICKRNF